MHVLLSGSLGRKLAAGSSALAAVVTTGLLAVPALGHQSGCHAAHSCPSDHHTYVWYSGTTGYDCVEPGAAEYDPSTDTTRVVYDSRTYYCRVVGTAPAPPPPDTDGDGVPDSSDACPSVAAATPNGCPAPPPPAADSDGDGRSDAVDSCPLTPAFTDNGCPTPTRTYIGDPGNAWTDRLQRPRRLVPCSADGGCQVIRLKWHHWGKTVASGRGTAKINDCQPYCARGHFHKFSGARVRAYRRRDGSCEGTPVRYYTRVRITWPRRAHFRRRMTVKLRAVCPFGA